MTVKTLLKSIENKLDNILAILQYSEQVERKARVLARQQRFRNKHCEEINAASREYYALHCEEMRRLSREYYAANIEKKRKQGRERTRRYYEKHRD